MDVAEQFLRKQCLARLDADKKLSPQSLVFKEKMVDHCILIWGQTHHRGEDAIRATVEHAKKQMNKGV